jgi:hypothetical protein
MKIKFIVPILSGFLLAQFNQAQVQKTSSDTEWFIYLNPAKGDDNNQGTRDRGQPVEGSEADKIEAGLFITKK